MANDNVTTLVQLKIDRPELEKTKRGVEQFKQLFGSVGKDFQKLGPLAQAGVTAIRSRFRLLGDGIDDARKKQKQYNETLQETIEQLQRVQLERAEQARQAVGDVSTTFGSLAGLVGGGSAVGGSLGLVGDFAGVVEYLPLFKKGIGDIYTQLTSTGPLTTQFAGNMAVMGGSIGIAAAALVAITIALDNYNQKLEANRKQLEGALNALDEYYKAISEGTVESVTEQIEQGNRRAEFLRREIADLQGNLDRTLNDAIRNFGPELANVLDKAGQLPTAQLREKLGELRTEYQTLIQTNVRLQSALDDGLIPATDEAADAEERLAKQRELSARINDITLKTLLEGERLTLDQFNERLQQNQREMELIQGLIDSGTVYGDQLAQYEERQRELGTANAVLLAQVKPLVEARDAEAKAAELAKEIVEGFIKTIQGLPGAMKGAGKEVSAILSKFQEAAEVMKKANDRIAEIVANQRQKERELARDRDRDLADAERDAGQSRNEAARDAQLERQKLEEEHQKALARIDQQYNRDSAVAIQDRNASALQQAQQARDDAKRDENQNYNERKRDIQRNLNETLRDINITLNEQRRSIIQRYIEQLNDSREAASRARQIEFQKAQEETRIKQQAAQQQLQIAANLARQQISLATQGARGFLSIISSAFRAFSGLSAGKSPLGNLVSGLIRRVTSFDTEGEVSRTGLAKVDKGEVIMKRQRLQQGGNYTFAPIFKGQTRAQIRKEFEQHLETFMDRAGL